MAKEFQTIIKVGMNSTNFNKSSAEVSRRIKLLDTSFKEAAARAKAFGETTETLKQKHTAISEKINIQTLRINKLKESLEKSTRETGESSKATEVLAIKYNQAVTNLRKMEGQLEAVNKDIKAQGKELASTEIKMKTFGEQARQVGTQAKQVGETLLKVSAVLIGLGATATKMSNDFGDSMAKVSTIVDEQKYNMDVLGDKVLQLSGTYGIGANQMANALYETLSAGVKTEKSIKFLDVAVKNSVTGFTDVTTSVNTLTNVMNAYNIESDRTIEISDKLLALQKYGKTTIGEFGDRIGQVAPLAAQANVSVEELFGSIATLTKNSIRSREAITGMKAIISNVIKPSAEATEEAKRLGINFSASGLKAKGFAEFLELVKKRTRGNTESLTKLFGSIEALNAVMLLTSQKGSSDLSEALNEISNSAGMTDEAMGKMNTRGFKMRVAFNKLKLSLIDLGDKVAPVFEVLTKVIESVASVVGKMDSNFLKFLTIMTIIVAVVGGAIMLFGTLTIAMSAMSIASSVMSISFSKVAIIIVGVTAAVAALVALIVVLTGKSKDVGVVGDEIAKGVNGITGSIQQPRQQSMNSYATGTNYLSKDQDIHAHEGEAIIPKKDNPFNPENSNKFGFGGDTYIINVDAKTTEEYNSLVEMARSLKETSNQGIGGEAYGY